MASLSAQTILITGASGGIGSALVQTLGQLRATLCLSGRDRKRLQDAAAGLAPERARLYPADLAKDDDLENAVRKILAEHQRLDAVIHCAAIIRLGAAASAPADDFDQQFQINVRVPYRLTQLLLPALISSHGQVIFLNSSAGLRARAGVGQYSATKHALHAVADSLREECNSSGVRVSSLFLGATATPMQAAVRAQQDRNYKPELLIQPADVARVVASLLLLPRTAEITDLMMRPLAKA